MKNFFVVPVKLKDNFVTELYDNHKKPILYISAFFGTAFVGAIVVRKIYLNKLNQLVDETKRRDDERSKKIKESQLIQSPKDFDKNKIVDLNISNENSPGLSILADKKPLNSPFSLDRVSLSSQFTNKFPRKRNVNSLCSYQINLQLDSPKELIIFSNEYVKRALKILEDVKLKEKDNQVKEFDEIDSIIANTKELIQKIQSFTKLSHSSSQNEQEIIDSPSRFESPEGSVSASLYSLEFYDIEQNLHFFKLYTSSLDNLNNIVKARVNRSQMVNCESLDEFYAKVDCLRKGFQHIFLDEKNCEFFFQIGELILKVLVTNSESEQIECLKIYKDMIEFISNPDNYDTINEELASRNIPLLSFYDLVIDYIILDSFEDLENPPSTIINVINQRWFGDKFKIKALQTAINIVLKHKRSKLKVTNGFFNRFYNLLEKISPILAWGFFGTDSDLKIKCNFIKQAIFEVVRDYFDFDRVRYTSLHDLTLDMLTVTDIRYDDLKSRLSIIM